MTSNAAINRGGPTDQPNARMRSAERHGSLPLADADIARTAEEVLRMAIYLPSEAVKVLVECGWVTLSGEVDWQYQKRAAAAAVAALSCVAGVTDHIAIRPKISMHAVKSDIEAALTRRARADAQKISVQISGGDVTLAGVVHSISERDLAWHSAWGAAGVRNVVDQMTVLDSAPMRGV